MTRYCCFHDHCNDGFTAAWLFARKFPDAVLLPVQYGKPLPAEVVSSSKGDTVTFVDFCPSLEQLQALTEPQVLILDHHATAQKTLAGFEQANIEVEFDMTRSGAGLVFRRYYTPKGKTWADTQGSMLLVDYIEDHDLWKHKLPEWEAIQVVTELMPKTLQAWDELGMRVQHMFEQTVAFGKGLLQYRDKLIEEAIENQFPIRLEGLSSTAVPCVNSGTFQSFIGNQLSVGQPYAVIFYIKGEYAVCSLRSQKDGGRDVGELAKRFGGGGHKNAAGFRVPLAELDSMILTGALP